jgi:hypothetical protein
VIPASQLFSFTRSRQHSPSNEIVFVYRSEGTSDSRADTRANLIGMSHWTKKQATRFSTASNFLVLGTEDHYAGNLKVSCAEPLAQAASQRIAQLKKICRR